MINLNTDITKLLQLESLNVSEKINKETSKVTSSNPKEEADDATKISVSKQVTNPLDELISEEDILSHKLNKAQTIYDTLSDIRLKLRDLIQIIKDPEMRFDENSLNQMDSMSNALIDNAISTIRKNDNMNIVNQDFLNIYINGLQNIRSLNFMDDDFLTKIQTIKDNIKIQENEYAKATESLYSKYIDISKKYNDLINNSSTVDSKNIDKQIIETSKQTLTSTTTNISPDTVKRLLQS